MAQKKKCVCVHEESGIGFDNMERKTSVDEKYYKICKKLRFVPSEYNHTYSGTEDDAKPNPFSVLTTDELMYLIENGYFETDEFH